MVKTIPNLAPRWWCVVQGGVNLKSLKSACAYKIFKLTNKILMLLNIYRGYFCLW